MTRNYYQVLGVDADASPEQIQAAYKHWARQLAPDAEAAEDEAFKELQQAYWVLAHPQRREAYNTRILVGRPASRAEPFRAEPAPAETTGAAPMLEVSLRESFNTAHPSFEELFDRLWSNFSDLTRPKSEHLEGLTLEVRLTPEQARLGGKARIMIPARAECPACGGHGALGVYQCWKCGGQGSITADYPIELAYPAGVVNAHDLLIQVEPE